MSRIAIFAAFSIKSVILNSTYLLIKSSRLSNLKMGDSQRAFASALSSHCDDSTASGSSQWFHHDAHLNTCLNNSVDTPMISSQNQYDRQHGIFIGIYGLFKNERMKAVIDLEACLK